MGHAVDMGAKIYSYRVDNVHQQAQKIISGLGRPERKRPGIHDFCLFIIIVALCRRGERRRRGWCSGGGKEESAQEACTTDY
jgi:hypothetical protein